ncbi:MAG: hypothetical protein U0790_28795 [Isosphaeraceae bacterium]
MFCWKVVPGANHAAKAPDGFGAEIAGNGPGTNPTSFRLAFRALAGLIGLLIAGYVVTASWGIPAVKRTIQGEAISEYQALRARVPGAVAPNFPGARFESCRVVFPGVISCEYSTYIGPRAASGRRALYFWDGSSCRVLRSRLLWVS